MLDRFLERNLFGLAYRHTETDFLLLINEKIGSLPVSKWQSALVGHIVFTQDPEIRLRLSHFNLGRFISIELGKMNSALRNILKTP